MMFLHYLTLICNFLECVLKFHFLQEKKIISFRGHRHHLYVDRYVWVIQCLCLCIIWSHRSPPIPHVSHSTNHVSLFTMSPTGTCRQCKNCRGQMKQIRIKRGPLGRNHFNSPERTGGWRIMGDLETRLGHFLLFSYTGNQTCCQVYPSWEC